MILNTRIWTETVNAAKAAASTSPAWLRAIDRAVIEIERSRYWSFADGILTIIQRQDIPHRPACSHRAARRLMLPYTERLNAQPAPTASRKACGLTDGWPSSLSENPSPLLVGSREAVNSHYG